ncbi:hypothetical protein OH492_10120 [Vibrio chagasii]|nr:hypothetical protein [Vibrio chagasii]
MNDIYLRTGDWLNDTLALQVEGNFLKGEASRRKGIRTEASKTSNEVAVVTDDTRELQAFVQRYDARYANAGRFIARRLRK